jgi:LPXTG-motif cell wall-anchored protein
MKRLVGFVSVLTILGLLVAAPGYAVTGVTGKATAETTILRATVGSTVVKIASDLAESLNTSTVRALSRFVAGSVGGTELPLGRWERRATRPSESDRESVGTGTRQIAGLAAVNVLTGAVDSAVSSSAVTSAVDFGVGTLDALAGFLGVGTVTSTTRSAVGSDASTATRSITIANVHALSLRTLLDQLGIDPLALACGAVESVGGLLGIGASSACEDLAAVTGEIADGNAQIGSLEGVVGTVETALNLICVVSPGTCAPVFTLIDQLQATIDGLQVPNPVPDTCATLAAALEDLADGVGAIVTQLDSLTGGILGDLTSLISDLTGALGALDLSADQLQAACDALLGVVGGVLDLPVLSLDGVTLSMSLAAKPGPSATVEGSIGALKVGNLTVVDASTLRALGESLQASVATINATLGNVFNALGLAGLPVPTVELLKPTRSAGKRANGEYYAEASMTAVHVGIPSASVNLPVDLPLDVLSGLGGFAPASVRAAAVVTPAVGVDLGVFSGSATWRAASGPTGGGPTGGATLPTTGVASSGLALAGLASLAGAGLLGRSIRRS